MKDEREKVIRLKRDYEATIVKQKSLAAAFQKVGCRYRNDLDTKCGHPRHNMKKYPQHQPRPPVCSPDVCPRQ